MKEIGLRKRWLMLAAVLFCCFFLTAGLHVVHAESGDSPTNTYVVTVTLNGVTDGSGAKSLAEQLDLRLESQTGKEIKPADGQPAITAPSASGASTSTLSYTFENVPLKEGSTYLYYSAKSASLKDYKINFGSADAIVFPDDNSEFGSRTYYINGSVTKITPSEYTFNINYSYSRIDGTPEDVDFPNKVTFQLYKDDSPVNDASALVSGNEIKTQTQVKKEITISDYDSSADYTIKTTMDQGQNQFSFEHTNYNSSNNSENWNYSLHYGYDVYITKKWGTGVTTYYPVPMLASASAVTSSDDLPSSINISLVDKDNKELKKVNISSTYNWNAYLWLTPEQFHFDHINEAFNGSDSWEAAWDMSENENGSYQLTVSNTPKLINYTVTKVWDDWQGGEIPVPVPVQSVGSDDSTVSTQEASDTIKRPETITLVLNQDGKPYLTREMIVSPSSTSDTLTFKNLPAGHQYTVEEVEVDGYTTTYGDQTVDSWGNITQTITNTISTKEPDTVNFSVEKTWSDYGRNSNPHRYDSVTIALYYRYADDNESVMVTKDADDNTIQPVTLNPKGNNRFWSSGRTATFRNLPAQYNGRAGTYYAREVVKNADGSYTPVEQGEAVTGHTGTGSSSNEKNYYPIYRDVEKTGNTYSQTIKNNTSSTIDYEVIKYWDTGIYYPRLEISSLAVTTSSSNAASQSFGSSSDIYGTEPDSLGFWLYQKDNPDIRQHYTMISPGLGSYEWNKSITGLDPSKEYDVEEDTTDGWKLTAKKTELWSWNGGSTRSIYLTNQAVGGLRVAKHVTGGDKNREFQFRVEVRLPNNNIEGSIGVLAYNSSSSVVSTLNGEYGTIYDKDGNATDDKVTFVGGVAVFSLKDGEYVDFSDIPAGSYYKVTETPAEGYTTSADQSVTGQSTGKTSSRHFDGSVANGQIYFNTDANVDYTNDYSVEPISLKLKAKKYVNDSTLTSGVYSISVLDDNDSREGIDSKLGKGGLVGTISLNAENHGEYEQEFSTISFTKAGTYHFIMREQAPDDAVAYNSNGEKLTWKAASDSDKYDSGYTWTYNGVTYDTKTVEATVTVTDDGKGHLKSSVTYTPDDDGTQQAAFSNTYTASGTAVIKAAKHISGRDWTADDAFTFELTPVNGAPLRTKDGNQTKLTTTALQGEAADEYAARTPSFPDLVYTYDDLKNSDGTHSDREFTYNIHEVIPNGATYEDGKYTYKGLTYADDQQVKVKVHDNGEGQLEVTYWNGSEWVNTVDAPDFYNTYTAGKTTSAEIKAVKQVEDGVPFPDNTYCFRMSSSRNDTPMPDGSVDYDTDKPGKSKYVNVANGNNGNRQTVSFGTITYTEPGDYEYTITEVMPGDSNPHASIDTTNPVIEVDGKKVVLDITSHSVHVHVADNNDGTLTATVTYGADNSTTPKTFTNRNAGEGLIVLSAQKHYSGATLLDGQFNYTLYKCTDDNFDISTATALGTATTRKQDNNNIGNINAAIPLKHDDISHTGDKPYTGTLYFACLEDNAGQTINGITYDSEPMYAIVKVKETDDHVLRPTAITYEKGNQKYTENYTYDEQGKATVTSEGTKPTFENSYKASGTATLDASKHISGREWKSGESFKFTLTPKDGAPLRTTDGSSITKADSLEATADSSNRIVDFPELYFDQDDLQNSDGSYVDDKTFTYTIHEENAGKTINGLTYAEDQDVTVNVHNNGDGTLRITYGSMGTNTPTNPQFVNTYKLTGQTSVSLRARKMLTGRSWKNGDSFSFTLAAGTNTAGVETPMPVTDTVKVTKSSPDDNSGGYQTKYAAFDNITFTKPGIYHYTIKEVIPEGKDKNDSITYDNASHDVTVTVADNMDGTLSASIVYGQTQNSTPAVFANSYYAEPVKALIPVKKELITTDGTTGPDIRNAFIFTIRPKSNTAGLSTGEMPMPKDADGNAVYWLSNPDSSGGTVLFENLEFTKEGTYTYTITETGTVFGVTNDADSVKTVTIRVNDDGRGHLSIGSVKSGTEDVNGVSPLTFTNTYKPEYTEISVDKVWDDSSNQDGRRPSAEEFKSWLSLYANAVDVTSQYANDMTIKSDGDRWTISWSHLPKYDDEGNEIAYNVKEVIPFDSPYMTKASCTGNGGTITNTYSTDKTSVSITKVWKDNNDQDGKRPGIDEFKNWLTLYADGDKVDAKDYTVTVADNQDNSYGVTYSNLPKYKDGKVIKYTVGETAASGYTSSLKDQKTVSNNGTITNTIQEETTSVSITKKWNDYDNKDGRRPNTDAFKSWLTLYANGKALTSDSSLAVVDNGDNTYTATWTGLPKNDGGEPIAYTVVETPHSGYAADKTSVSNGETITNSSDSLPQVETESITITKIWDDSSNANNSRPSTEDFKDWLTLSADGRATSVRDINVVDNGDNSYTVTYSNLPKYDDNGKEISYAVNENIPVNAPYTSKVHSVSSGGRLLNTYEPQGDTKDVSFTKVWVDEHNEKGFRSTTDEFKHQVHLVSQKNQEVKAESVVVDNGDDTYTVTYKGLPKYDEAGNELNYYLIEEDLSNGYLGLDENLIPVHYWPEVDGKFSTGTTIYNIRGDLEPQDETSVKVTKKWNDNNNADKLRPENVEVQLYANGSPYGDKIALNAGNSWSCTWEKLPTTDSNGNTISYTVQEGRVNGYISKVSGSDQDYTITNTESVNIPVEQRWTDGASGDSSVITLTENGEKTDKTLTLTKDTDWQGTFSDLPKYNDDGEVITYNVVEETATDDYNVSVEEDGNGGFVVTNSGNSTNSTDPSNPEDSEQPTTQTDQNTVGTSVKTGVKTGAETAPFAIAALAGLGICILAAERKERK